MPAGQCVEPLSNGHKKISFNSPPTPNRTRNTINECYLGKRGHVIPLLSGLKPPSWEVQLSIHLQMTMEILPIWVFQMQNFTHHRVKLSEFFCHSEITWNWFLGIVELQKPATLTFLEVLNFDFNEFLHFLEAEIYQYKKFRASKTAKKGNFWTCKIPKIDFTCNLICKKI